MAGYQIGRLGTVLVGEEATYGTTPTLLASMALRHLNFRHSFRPFNRINSPEKKATPGVEARFDRRKDADYELEAWLRPSGVIATIPECSLLLEHGLGSKVIGTFTTTTTAAAHTTTSFTATATTGLTLGEFIYVIAGGIRYARVVTNIAGSVVTFAPAVPVAVDSSSATKAGVTYKLGTNLAKSLSIIRYLPDISWALKGAVIDRLRFAFGNNEETRIMASGPAQLQVRPAPASPGFTAVGGNPPSGLTGGLFVNGSQTAMKFLGGDLEVANGEVTENEEYGTNGANGFHREGRRDVTASLRGRVTDITTAYALAETGADLTLLLQTGVVEGNMHAVYAPRAEFADIPDTPDDDGSLEWTYKVVCKEISPSVGNSEITVGLL